MSDEFGTVNIKPRSAERSREIEVMRQHYRRHHDALKAMAADAPTETLAAEYRRLLAEIESAFAKLDELEHRPASTDTQPMKTAPGTRPLVTPPAATIPVEAEPASAQSRIIIIVLVGLVVLGLLGWLMWRASSDERPETPVVESPQVVETVETTTVAPAVEASALSVEPVLHDYGAVRKGTRAARQFEIVNTGDEPIKVDVTRSNCKCLYYDYADVIPPKGKETLTVTVDGAKAAAGTLQETIRITAESDPSITTSFEVTATIR
ncbi:MAG TPA: DUF1573 domain-containing protein [Thermoanaerobaculia bacterium]|nr:DUF1573 domain-containing protein [Thermoanaerobaculia bacterium]